MFDPSSRGRLTVRDVGRFAGGRLFNRIGRAVCRAGCVPRKELYEAWEMARRVRRRLRGGRVVDLCCGCGLLAQMMLILDDSSPSALLVDKVFPPSSSRLHEELLRDWPRLSGRVQFADTTLDRVDVLATDLVVASHACGALTDRVIERAVRARARVAVMPCCHDLGRSENGDIAGWVEGAVAIDIVRALRLKHLGYRIWTQSIPERITPKNRLLIGEPDPSRPAPGVVGLEASRASA